MLASVEISVADVVAFLAIAAPLCTVAAFLVRLTLGSRLAGIEKRLDGHDDDMKTVVATTTSTRVALARVEGYMSRSNGGLRAGGDPDRLPATDLSTRIARDLPDDVVSKLPEGDYQLLEPELAGSDPGDAGQAE